MGYADEVTETTYFQKGFNLKAAVGPVLARNYHSTVVDRLKELIKSRGFQVPPAEIEHILVGHPDVRDAAVVGEPHPEYGEVPVGYVVRRERAVITAEELIEFAAKGLAKYKRLTRVTFVDAIPRSASGKILRRVLKESPPA